MVLGEDGGDAVSGNWKGYLATEPEPQSDIRGSVGFELYLKRSGSDDVSGTMTLQLGNDATPVRLAVVSSGLRWDRLAFSAQDASPHRQALLPSWSDPEHNRITEG